MKSGARQYTFLVVAGTSQADESAFSQKTVMDPSFYEEVV